MRPPAIAALSALVLVLAPTRSQNADREQGEAVIAAERAALDKWSKGDPSGFLANYADDVTYFDPMHDARVDGLAAMRAMLEPLSGKFTIHRYEIVHPKVQRHGDVAVLTYNLVNYQKLGDGAERPLNRWNSTSVFHRVGGRWRQIHSHWSFTKPELKAPPTG
jgi:ketosteroid isomerase-like protein